METGVLLVAVVAIGAWVAWKSYQKSSRQWVCTQCKSIDSAATNTKGSILIEIVLWLCFIVPGLLYSLWRHTAREQVCRACGSTSIVPADSPRGRELTKDVVY